MRFQASQRPNLLPGRQGAAERNWPGGRKQPEQTERTGARVVIGLVVLMLVGRIGATAVRVSAAPVVVTCVLVDGLAG